MATSSPSTNSLEDRLRVSSERLLSIARTQDAPIIPTRWAAENAQLNAQLRRANLTLKRKLKATEEARDDAVADVRRALANQTEALELHREQAASVQKRMLIELNRLEESVEAERRRADALQHALDGERRLAIGGAQAYDERAKKTTDGLLALKNRLNAALLQIEVFARKAPAYVLREVAQACESHGHKAPHEFWPFDEASGKALAVGEVGTQAQGATSARILAWTSWERRP